MALPHEVGRRRASGVVAGAFAAVVLVPVAAPATADDTGATVDLGTITVTARRRGEKIMDAPVAVTVQTGEQLQDQNAVLFDDVGREVPNVRMTQSPTSVSALDVTIRGQSAIRSAIAYDPAVGIYVDGVYVANGQAAMNTLLDIDKVQIIRGTQGTLFGRDNTGGSILFTTRRPELKRWSSEVALDGGTDNLFTGRAIANVPLGDTAALRFAYQDNERDGFGSSLASGQDHFGNQHRYQGRVSALWRPNPGTEAFWSYEHFEADEVGALLHPLHGPGAGTIVAQFGDAIPLFPGLPPVIFPSNFRQTDADFSAHDRTHLDATQLTLTQDVGESTHAKLILGYRHLYNDTAIDVDATSLPFANTALQNSSSQKSAELQLSGTTPDRKLDWVGGLYWFRDDGSAPSEIPAQSPAYQAFFAATGGPVVPYPVIESNSLENLSTAGYLHGEYHLTDRWAAAAGIRRTEDTRKLGENAYAATPLGQSCTIIDAATGLPANNGGPCPPIDKSVRFSYWSWELSTRYRLTDDVNAYFRSGRAQRSGGWNVPVNTLQDQPFRPEQLTDYELGLKSDLLGGRLAINADVFYGNYDDMQRLLPQLVGGTPTTYVINAGKARVSGAEIEADMDLARGWSMRAAFGWTDARYRQFELTPGPGLPPVNLAGNEFNQAPRFNAALGVGYVAFLPRGRLRLHADYAWQDAVQFNVVNDFNKQGAYGTLNVRLAYAVPGDRWELALFGTNLTDRQYAVTGGTVAPNAMAWQIPGPPREVGVELSYRFSRGG
jgi:iron complex outermembrane receptor protein